MSGEHYSVTWSPELGIGSSPRERGARMGAMLDGVEHGIIPA